MQPWFSFNWSNENGWIHIEPDPPPPPPPTPFKQRQDTLHAGQVFTCLFTLSVCQCLDTCQASVTIITLDTCQSAQISGMLHTRRQKMACIGLQVKLYNTGQVQRPLSDRLDNDNASAVRCTFEIWKQNDTFFFKQFCLVGCQNVKFHKLVL